MKIHVVKFGGSSLKDAFCRDLAAARVLEHLQQADAVIAIVSAMGRFPDCYATDTLASLAAHLSSKEKGRLMSLGETLSSLVFLSCCKAHCINACALSIEETGIITDDNYQKAHVMHVSDRCLKKALKEHELIIVPGFTGISLTGNVVTLGRGGSDYSAFLIAEALNLQFVTIYTDVDGVYDKDPKKHDDAKIYSRLNCSQLLQLIDSGAKVMQKDSVLYAEKHELEFEVRCTFHARPGTIVTPFQKSSAGSSCLKSDIENERGITSRTDLQASGQEY